MNSGSVNSESDGVNSDIATLVDFSDDNETWVEQLPGCPIPGCQCEGHIEFMEWGSEGYTWRIIITICSMG